MLMQSYSQLLVEVRRFFQFHSQEVCEYKNVTTHFKNVIIKGKALTYHAVHKKPECTSRNGLSTQQNVRPTNENRLGTSSVTIEKIRD